MKWRGPFKTHKADGTPVFEDPQELIQLNDWNIPAWEKFGECYACSVGCPEFCECKRTQEYMEAIKDGE